MYRRPQVLCTACLSKNSRQGRLTDATTPPALNQASYPADREFAIAERLQEAAEAMAEDGAGDGELAALAGSAARKQDDFETRKRARLTSDVSGDQGAWRGRYFAMHA